MPGTGRYLAAALVATLARRTADADRPGVPWRSVSTARAWATRRRWHLIPRPRSPGTRGSAVGQPELLTPLESDD